MPAASSYSYAFIRVVPRVDRGEFINAGVIVFSPERRFLSARVHLDARRLHALWPSLDQGNVQRHLESIRDICSGSARSGPIGAMTQKERFHWLTSPRSAMIQPSPVRTGLSNDPQQVLAELEQELIAE